MLGSSGHSGSEKNSRLVASFKSEVFLHIGSYRSFSLLAFPKNWFANGKSVCSRKAFFGNLVLFNFGLGRVSDTYANCPFV